MTTSRRSGMLVPLFSLTSRRSWGVGEFLDLPFFARWVAAAGHSFVQLLPISEIPDHETSPYSALTATALDPIYVSLPALEDFSAIGGESRLPPDDRSTLEFVRRDPRVRHTRIRALKTRWLRRAHERFLCEEVAPVTARAARFARFVQEEAWWLDDYALFQALRGVHALRAWWDWPEPMARRHDAALARARSELAAEIGYRKYVQWVAAEQWTAARQQSAPVRIFGDLPFMISADSPDVWTQQNEFRFDATVGVPPDAFSETGQDWGLPPCRWDVMEQSDFAWIRCRARRNAALFDGFRVDHLVGLYRTYNRPLDKNQQPFLAPAEESEQIALGERLVRIYLESGAEVVAEDLGTVPDFVRASLARMGVPGFKVLRWERAWHTEGKPYLDPTTYPEASVATTGTHDTEPLITWWESLSVEERDEVLAIPTVARLLSQSGDDARQAARAGFTPSLNDALLRTLYFSGSRLVILPLQDIFGWPDRINTPATVSDDNWAWRLPWPADALLELEQPRARAEQLRAWTAEASRT